MCKICEKTMKFKNRLLKFRLPWRMSRQSSPSRSAFTMIEMLVVIGMLGILMGVTFGGIGRARSRARVAKANTEVRELVNAILSYEAAEGSSFRMIAGDPKEATAANLKDLLGDGNGPVYLNAPLVGNAFRDPWGTPYRYRVIQATISSGGEMSESISATVTFPNRQRGVR